MKHKIISIVACFFLSVFICIIGYNVVSNQLFELKNTPNVIYKTTEVKSEPKDEGPKESEPKSSDSSGDKKDNAEVSTSPKPPVGADLYQHIPNMEYTNDQGWVYHIQKGDTLTYISSITGVGVDELANYNGVRNNHEISETAYIRVPVLNK